MRVTNTILLNTALANIRKQSTRLFQTQEEASSGKRIHRPSDSPIDTRHILDLRATLRSLEQFKRNRATGITLLQETDTALEGFANILLRAKTLALSAVNATVSPENKRVMADEVGQLFAQAIHLGNTAVAGRYIFAGRANDQPPFSMLATTESQTRGLMTAGTPAPLAEGELMINGTQMRATQAADDTVSTVDNAASALAIATAINEAAAITGVHAEASTTLALTILDFGDLTGNNLVINGVAVTGTVTDATSLVDAINAANIPGVVASSTLSDTLILTAVDGRNMQLETDGLSAGNMEFAGFDVGGGVALDQTAIGTVTLRAESGFTIGGLNPANAGFSAGPVNLTASFQGDNGTISLDMNTGQSLAVNIRAGQFLISDLQPSLDHDTPLSSLRQGQGISAGSIRITDRSGGTAVIDLSTAITIGDVIDTINATGLEVTAAINEGNNGLVITDTAGFPTQNLTITEVGSGTTASALGLVADRPGTIVGPPLNPVLTVATPLALLYEGRGVVPTRIRIVNGLTDVEHDLSRAQTIGEVLTILNSSSVRVTARINETGTGLEVRSNDPNTVAIVTEVEGGTTAAALGFQGGQDLLKTLSLLQEALQKNDEQALQALLTSLDEVFTQVSNLRADTGTRTNRIALIDTSLDSFQFSITSQLSLVEDADFIEVLTRLSHLTTAYEAALGATARTIQSTLLDFLR
jgi:flagellin-like hook-associated protein FlgL